VPDDEIASPFVGTGFGPDEIEHRVKKFEFLDVAGDKRDYRLNAPDRNRAI
jgi:hypothetical protein